MSESERIWDLLQRAYEGNVWHGPSLRHLLGEVTAEQAAARPIAAGRTIWETVVHLTAQVDAVRQRLEGAHVDELPREASWPAVTDTTPAAWREVVRRWEEAHHRLRRALSAFPEARLSETVPWRDYPYYLMLYGVIQHDLYHAGQIVALMQAQGLQPQG